MVSILNFNSWTLFFRFDQAQYDLQEGFAPPKMSLILKFICACFQMLLDWRQLSPIAILTNSHINSETPSAFWGTRVAIIFSANMAFVSPTRSVKFVFAPNTLRTLDWSRERSRKSFGSRGQGIRFGCSIVLQRILITHSHLSELLALWGTRALHMLCSAREHGSQAPNADAAPMTPIRNVLGRGKMAVRAAGAGSKPDERKNDARLRKHGNIN